MGKASEVVAALRKTRDQEWVLDPATGAIKPEVAPGTEVEAATVPQPKPVQAAYETYD